MNAKNMLRPSMMVPRLAWKLGMPCVRVCKCVCVCVCVHECLQACV
jgi:hypothetical protein